MTRKKTVAFGELLLRLSAPGYERLLQTPTLHAHFGGGEANVAMSLAAFGLDSHFVSRLPRNAIGDVAIRALRAEGVDVSAIQRGGDRLGLYFTEKGASQRPSCVVYDRASSAFIELAPGDVCWPEVLRDASWFHTTGITPALGGALVESTRTALVAARRAGARVSFDVNYRSKLWTQEEARRVILPLLRHVHVLIANEGHLTDVLGLAHGAKGESTPSGDLGRLADAAARAVAEHGVELVAITLRESLSASENGWSALLYDGATGTMYRGPRYVVQLVDRIGGGDAFAAGLAYSLLEGRPLDDALRFAVAAGALKLTVVGDFNRVSVEEIEWLAAGHEDGRVSR